MEKWRLIIDGDRDGFYNMACDEAVFLNYLSLKVPTLRIYSWKSPFITLGYFQKASKVLKLDRLKTFGIDFTRRITGGALILHHQEITYSISLSQDDLVLPKRVKESYKVLTSFLIHFYRKFGLNARFFCDCCNYHLQKEDYGNLCFATYQAYDILIDGKKIGGSAQKRCKKFIFQHGSIPLRVDFSLIENTVNTEPFKEKTQGLECFLNREISKEELKRKLSEAFKDTFRVELVEDKISKEEERVVSILLKEKYKNNVWRFRHEETSLVK